MRVLYVTESDRMGVVKRYVFGATTIRYKKNIYNTPRVIFKTEQTKIRRQFSSPAVLPV